MSAVEDFSPVAVEGAIRECSNRIAKGVAVCAERQSALLRAEHAYDLAFARAYLAAADQPAHARKYIAELATAEERSARDVAEVAYRHAERQAKALDAELRSWQSIGASIRSQWGVAGVGER